MKKSCFVYILLCADDTYYTGYCVDLDQRIKQHNEGKGAKYTRSRGPVSLAYSETCTSKSEAMKREAAIKKLSRKEKTLLITTGT